MTIYMVTHGYYERIVKAFSSRDKALSYIQGEAEKYWHSLNKAESLDRKEKAISEYSKYTYSIKEWSVE